MPATRYTKTISKRRTNKKIRNKKSRIVSNQMLLFIFVSLVAFSLLGGVIFFNVLNKRLAGAESQNTLNQDYYTVVYGVVDSLNNDAPILKKLQFMIFDLNTKKITKLNLLMDYKISEFEGFSDETVAKLLALGRLNHDKIGSLKFVNSAVFDLFALPVDRYIYVNEGDAWSWEGLFSEGQFINVLTRLMSQNPENPNLTNMELSDIYQMSQFIKDLPQDRITSADFRDDLQAVVDYNIREMTLGLVFSQEATNVAVLNGSDTPGVATFAARVISNLGGRVVSIDNAENQFDESFIVADNVDLASVALLAQTFGVTKVITKEQASKNVSDGEMYRADILLILAK